MHAGVDRERQRMDALRRYHLLDTAPNERFDRITLLTAQIFRVPTAVITLIDEQRQWFAARVGTLIRETARDIAFCNSTIQGDEVLVVQDAARDPLFQGNPLVTSEPELRFYAGAPLRTDDGHNIGTVAVIDYQPREFGPWEQRVLKELTRFVMSEFELWRRVHALGEEHRAEMHEATRQHRLERELVERRFRALVEHAPNLTLLLDSEARVRFANAASQTLLGYAPAELYGADAFELFLPSAHREEARAWLRELGHAPGALRAQSWVFRHRDGREVQVSATVQNLFDDPAVSGFVLNARDVTLEAHALLELERARAQLRQAERMEAVGRLAGGIAHDFNNLLTVVINSAAFALRKLPPESPALRDLEHILDAGERGAALTRHILTFSQNRLTSMEPADLNQLVGSVLDLLRRVLGERIELALAMSHDLPIVRVDRSQLEQVLINLCVNARDAIVGTGKITLATSRVEVTPDVAVRYPWITPGPHVRIAVRDTGVGMPPQVVEHAFEPFFTTKPVGQGTGLGLATAYGSVRQHGGYIEIHSEEGRGTEVRVYLPASEGSAERAGEAQVRTQARTPGRGHGAILLAEDDELVRQVAQSALQDAGYRVYAARDGAEAAELFSQYADEVRLAVLDAVMPRLTGLEALERMRSLRPDLRYLVVSGYDLDAERLPPGRWFAKPYNAEDLVTRVRAVLGD